MAEKSCDLRRAGHAYPRTCEVCRLGPCQSPDPIPASQRQALVAEVMRASEFLVSKGHRDTAAFSAPTVVDLLCEFAALPKQQS